MERNMEKLTIDDLQLKDKRVLVRVDFNVPLDKKCEVTDDRRIVESLPTIKKILQDGGNVPAGTCVRDRAVQQLGRLDGSG